MPVSLFGLVLLSVLALPSNSDVLANTLHTTNGPVQPLLPPDASLTATSEPDLEVLREQVAAILPIDNPLPARIRIPAARVDSPVIALGVNAAGEMEVPDGSTNLVGWYKYGTTPGARGSAVMDAHVFAAFKRLKHAGVDDRIYVTDAGGATREFAIISSKVYPLANVPMEAIFTDVSGTYLNLITCEGRYSVAKGTYSHRRVVYAQLIE